VAAGPARETGFSLRLAPRAVDRCFVFDQDELALEVAQREYGDRGVRPLRGAIQSFISRKFPETDFDLIYSAGLYDYLDTRLAQRLTARLFEHLRPGGELLLANFDLGFGSRGYMQSFMDWYLIYRSEEEVRAFASEIDPNAIDRLASFLDPLRSVWYLTILRRASG
jgi:extracellular factor (EF) 3-hydroxypalmitic acid methyl ester biosynthesis protein